MGMRRKTYSGHPAWKKGTFKIPSRKTVEKIKQSLDQSINQSINQSVNQSISCQKSHTKLVELWTVICIHCRGCIQPSRRYRGQKVNNRFDPRLHHPPISLVPRHQIFRARPAALSKNRVWTPSLVKLGRNYTSVVSCCRTNQIAQVK